jgi:hypothetical protein
VDLLGFPGGGRLFSTKRVSPLENIAEFLRRQSCPKLDVLTAEKVFGWQKVHTSIKVRLSVRSKIRPGRWRSAKVPSYSTDSVQAYVIDERVKQLGKSERYHREISKITPTNS